jgi:hypothetical protein
MGKGSNLESKREGSVDIEELANKIRRRPYSPITDNCLVKSTEFAKRCTEIGVEAKVVVCVAYSGQRIPLLGFIVPVVGLHFYAEVRGRRCEVSREPRDEKRFGIHNNRPKVLARLGKF